MEKRGLLTRTRDQQDERLVKISITQSGEELKAMAMDIPALLSQQLPIKSEEARLLVRQLQTILNSLS